MPTEPAVSADTAVGTAREVLGASALAAAAARDDVDECDVACGAMPGLVCGDVPPSDEAWIAEHVRGCGFCRHELRRFERVDEALIGFGAVSIAPPPLRFLQTSSEAAYATIDSPIGPLFVAVTDQGLCEIGFGGHEDEASFRRQLEQRGLRPVPDGNRVANIASQLHEYFLGTRNRFEVPLDFCGVSAFTRSVLEATNAVPFGQLTTYRGIAERIGRPSAARAVGNALGRNPIPIVVPCHRIVASGGGIGGYTGGLGIKQALLGIEGVTLV